MGGVLRNHSGTKDPALLIAPADIAIGKRWRSAFTNTGRDGATSNNFWEHRVVALEDVAFPPARSRRTGSNVKAKPGPPTAPS